MLKNNMKMSVWAMAVSLVGCLAFILTGCNSNNSSGSASDGPKVDTVIIESMQFKPQEITIRQGDTIVWINKGIVAHNVTEAASQAWTSGDFEVGSSWKTVPERDFNYLCTIHPTMTGSVVVSKIK